MREIIFRGKRMRDRTWVTGSLVVWPNGDTEICMPKPDRENEMSKMCVYPETVGQFIGVTDKHGCRIFEGDIVMYKDEPGVIQYTEDETMYSVHFDTWCTDFDHIYPKSVEVVGNIHDNPQLLGGGGE